MRPRTAALVLFLAGSANALDQQETDQQCQSVMAAANTAQNRYLLLEDDLLAFLCEQRSATDLTKVSDDIIKYKPRLRPGEDIASVPVARLKLLAEISSKNKYRELLKRIPDGVSEVEVILPAQHASQFDKANSGRLFRPKPCLTCTDGHYGITQQALRQLTSGNEGHRMRAAYPNDMHELLADASQDGDFYAWDSPAAHAQTGSDESSTCQASACQDSNPDCWKQKMYDWVKQQLERARDACKTHKGREALYFVGYSLHAVQDLAMHQGRTNCEHAYNAYISGHNPDKVEPYSRLARKITQEYLKAVAGPLVQFCGQSLSNLSFPRQPQSTQWKRETLKSGLSPAGMLSYRFNVAPRYQKLLQAKGEPPIRWLQTGVDEAKPQSTQELECTQDNNCRPIMDALLSIPIHVFSAEPSGTAEKP
jgi:hypothetical protein